jgi:predicted Zn-dependent peptidase
MSYQYEKIVLNNGTRLILVPDSSKHVVTTLFVFGVGSRFETETKAGISHVLEHMHYKGTKKRPSAISVAEFIEDIGGEHNAFTSKEYTGYYTKVAAKHLCKSVDFLSDLINEPLFDSEELEREKSVILQELDMYQDLPMDLVANNFERVIFGNNSLGRDVIGYKDSIKSLTRDDLISFKNKYYNSNNTVVILCGNFSEYSKDELIKMFSNLSLLKGQNEKEFLSVQSKQYDNLKLKSENKKIEQSHIVLGFKGVSYDHPDRYKLKMLALILGGSMSSRMFIQIREKMGLAYTVRTSASNYLDTGTIETYAGVEDKKTFDALKAIYGQYMTMLSGVKDEELKRAKEIIDGRLLISMEDTSELANFYAVSELLTGRIQTPTDVSAIYQKVTTGDIIEVAKRYLVPENMAVSYVGQGFSDIEINNFLKELK